MPTLKDALNNANPNTLATMLAALGLGGVMRQQAVPLVKQAPATAPTTAAQPQLATLWKLALPDDAKASSIRQAWSRAGTVTGRLTPQAPDATPATTQIGIAPNGDITVLAADAITSLDVEYEPAKYDVVTVEGIVSSNDFTIPAQYTSRGVMFLIAANATLGTTPGQKIVVAAGARSSTSSQVNLDVAKTKVQFVAAEAITYCKLTLAVYPAIDVNAKLSAASDFIGG